MLDSKKKQKDTGFSAKILHVMELGISQKVIYGSPVMESPGE